MTDASPPRKKKPIQPVDLPGFEDAVAAHKNTRTDASPPQQPEARSTTAFPGERFPGQSFTVEQLARAIQPDQPETHTYPTSIAQAQIILSRLEGAVEPPLPVDGLREALEWIATRADRRSDGTYNYDRDALRQKARDALAATPLPLPVDPQAVALLREVAAGWEVGPGPYEVDMRTVNKVVNFLSATEPTAPDPEPVALLRRIVDNIPAIYDEDDVILAAHEYIARLSGTEPGE